MQRRGELSYVVKGAALRFHEAVQITLASGTSLSDRDQAMAQVLRSMLPACPSMHTIVNSVEDYIQATRVRIFASCLALRLAYMSASGVSGSRERIAATATEYCVHFTIQCPVSATTPDAVKGVFAKMRQSQLHPAAVPDNPGAASTVIQKMLNSLGDDVSACWLSNYVRELVDLRVPCAFLAASILLQAYLNSTQCLRVVAEWLLQALGTDTPTLMASLLAAEQKTYETYLN